MTQLDIRNIITKYIHQEISSEEMIILYEWIKKGNNTEVFKKLVQSDFLINYQNKSWKTEEAFKQFMETIKEKENKKVRTLYINRHVWKYAAAAVLILISSTYFLLNRGSQNLISPQVDSNQITLQLDNDGEVLKLDLNNDATFKSKSGSTLVSIAQGMLSLKSEKNSKGGISNNILKVPYGKNLSVTLPDGTVVMLNSGSTLTYPSSFSGKQKREVYLKGEAFFEVFKNPEQPFIVNTEKMYTQVFGTIFNLSAYEDDDVTEVVLVEGSVGVGKVDHVSTENLQMLKPSQKASNIDNMENDFIIENVDITPYISWTQDVVEFKNEKMSQIIKRLQRQFNVRIINHHKELGEREFTGMFDKEDIESILKTIQAHTHFSYSKDGNTIIIESEKP